MTTDEALVAVDGLIASGWVQGALAVDKDRNRVEPTAAEACAWCLLGACLRVRHEFPEVESTPWGGARGHDAPAWTCRAVGRQRQRAAREHGPPAHRAGAPRPRCRRMTLAELNGRIGHAVTLTHWLQAVEYVGVEFVGARPYWLIRVERFAPIAAEARASCSCYPADVPLGLASSSCPVHGARR